MLSRLGFHLHVFHAWRASAGIGPYLSWKYLKLRHWLGAGIRFWRVRPRQANHELWVRYPGSSDSFVFAQIFLAEQYGVMCELQNVRTVIDLGANVGYSAAYFLSQFPNCRVLAVEPDPVNFEACRRNLEPYGSRVDLLQGAVWSTNSRLTVERGVHGDGLDWGTQVRARIDGDDDSLPAATAWTLPELIERIGGAVDILKVDIEGAEAEILRDASWLRSTRNLCIELHDEAGREAFDRAISRFDCQSSEAGDLTVCLGIVERGALCHTRS